MPSLELLGWATSIAVVYMTGVWVLSLALRNAGIVDSFWGPGFALLAATLPFVAGRPGWRSLLILAMVAVWAVRLSVHITARSWGKPEDWRYRNWRKAAGRSFWWRSFFKVFLLQGVLLVLVAAPILVVALARGPVRWTLFDIVGPAVWLFGLSFEAIADHQLTRFKRDPESHGRVMDTGLWRYSRHPNYFGEAVLWWGIFLVALAVPGGYASAVGPVAITFLLVRVSGVRMLEAGLRERRRGYTEYVRRTSPLIPLPRRRR